MGERPDAARRVAPCSVSATTIHSMPTASQPPLSPSRRKRRGARVFQPLVTKKGSAGKRQLFLTGKNGTVFYLRNPLAAGGLYRERRRPKFWRSLAPSLAGGKAVSEGRLNDWLLILSAKKIPYEFSTAGDRPRLYVPPLYEMAAVHEITAFERERSLPIFVPPKRDNIPGVLAFLLLLALWHGFRWGWFDLIPPSPPFPESARAWASAFGLDVYRATVRHEWWRSITALTLHADEPHLFSNIGFGLIFLGALCRRAGLGLGIFLAIAGGIAGNVCNALTREPNILSIGFSTALFAAIGCHCALAGGDVVRHLRRHAGESADGADFFFRFLWRICLPLAAGAALLGLTGGGGEARADYPAHIWGFCCGVVICTAFLPLEKRIFSLSPGGQRWAQGGLLLAGLALLAGAWIYALF